MKKALASIVLLASSAGVFALPAAAHDRDDHVVTYNYNVRRDRDRDWRDARRVNVRDFRGYGYSAYDRNCR
jgi:Ni/Co efflux regulator RcnB